MWGRGWLSSPKPTWAPRRWRPGREELEGPWDPTDAIPSGWKLKGDPHKLTSTACSPRHTQDENKTDSVWPQKRWTQSSASVLLWKRCLGCLGRQSKRGSQANGVAILGSRGPWPSNLPLGVQSAGPLALHTDPALASKGHLCHRESCCAGWLPATVTRSGHTKPGTATFSRTHAIPRSLL